MGFSSKTRPGDINQGVIVNNQWAQRLFDYLTFFPIKQKLILIQPRQVKGWTWGSCAFILYLWFGLLCRDHCLTLHHQALKLLLFLVGTEGNMDPPPQNHGSRNSANPLLWGFTSMGAPGQPTSSSTSQKGTAFSSHFHLF